MEWVTVYEAGRFNGIIEFKIGIPVLIIGVLAMMLYVSICRDEKKEQMNASKVKRSKKGKSKNKMRKADEGRTIMKSWCMILGIMLLLFGGIFTGKGILGVINGQFVPDSFYYENYEVIEGVPENGEWYRSGFRFTVDETDFSCSTFNQIKRDIRIRKPFENGAVFRVFYDADNYYDNYYKEYDVVRIDILTAADE